MVLQWTHVWGMKTLEYMELKALKFTFRCIPTENCTVLHMHNTATLLLANLKVTISNHSVTMTSRSPGHFNSLLVLEILILFEFSFQLQNRVV